MSKLTPRSTPGLFPIVLLHGIVASDRFAESLFWGRIPMNLRKAGFLVFPGRTDSFGSVEGNSRQIAKTVATVLKETGCTRVLLLAHSKGGIDARHYVSTHRENAHVAGLVTVCTPHGGSELADVAFAKGGLKAWRRFLPDLLPAPLAATMGLTTDSMATFDRRYPDFPQTMYAAYHTRMASRSDDPFLSWTHDEILRRAGPNDGVVSIRSATERRQSQEIVAIRGGVSHIEMLDLKRRKVSGLDIPEVWVQIARDAMRAL